MLLKILKNKKAQNTAEYAILIGLVIGAVVAMQTYAQRTMQARIRDVNVTFRDKTGMLGNTLQYEPYYAESNSTTEKDSTATERLESKFTESTVNKESVEVTKYNAEMWGTTEENPAMVEEEPEEE